MYILYICILYTTYDFHSSSAPAILKWHFTLVCMYVEFRTENMIVKYGDKKFICFYINRIKILFVSF